MQRISSRLDSDEICKTLTRNDPVAHNDIKRLAAWSNREEFAELSQNAAVACAVEHATAKISASASPNDPAEDIDSSTRLFKRLNQLSFVFPHLASIWGPVLHRMAIPLIESGAQSSDLLEPSLQQPKLVTPPSCYLPTEPLFSAAEAGIRNNLLLSANFATDDFEAERVRNDYVSACRLLITRLCSESAADKFLRTELQPLYAKAFLELLPLTSVVPHRILPSFEYHGRRILTSTFAAEAAFRKVEDLKLLPEKEILGALPDNPAFSILEMLAVRFPESRTIANLRLEKNVPLKLPDALGLPETPKSGIVDQLELMARGCPPEIPFEQLSKQLLDTLSVQGKHLEPLIAESIIRFPQFGVTLSSCVRDFIEQGLNDSMHDMTTDSLVTQARLISAFLGNIGFRLQDKDIGEILECYWKKLDSSDPRIIVRAGRTMAAFGLDADISNFISARQGGVSSAKQLGINSLVNLVRQTVDVPRGALVYIKDAYVLEDSEVRMAILEACVQIERARGSSAEKEIERIKTSWPL